MYADTMNPYKVAGLVIGSGLLSLLLLFRHADTIVAPFRPCSVSTEGGWPMRVPEWYNASVAAGGPPFRSPYPSLWEEGGSHGSQQGEDAYAFEHFFYGLAGGSYLEIGGLDGLTYSNSLFFHKHMAWHGLLVEGDPFAFAKLKANRPHDITANAAVCKERQKVHYMASSDPAVGGIMEFMNEEFKTRWHHLHSAGKLIEVDCVPLQEILAYYKIHHVDFFSLDVEGGELMVLESLNFDCFSASVIVVELDNSNPSKDEAVRQLLAKNGYMLSNRTTSNEWFVHSSFVPAKRV